MAVNTGRLLLIPKKTGTLPVRTVTPSSQLENNGRLLFNYVTNVVTYTYSYTETVYLKVTNVVKPTH